MPYVIRRATGADAEDVRAITRAAYAKWVPLIGREPKPMTADYAHAVAHHIVDVAERDGRLVGLVETIPGDGHLLIENIAISPEAQGQGLGDHLLAHAEVLARSRGFNETRLYTNVMFTSNIAFYAKRGYAEFMRETFPGGSIAVHMRKVLAAPPVDKA